MILNNDSGEPHVFANFTEAAKHVANFVEPEKHRHILYANETPVMGAGDVEDTNGAKCLKCGGQLVLSNKQCVSEVPGMGRLAVDLHECPTCDPKERRH
ncbi:hypothetical protein [Shewanella gaetbuli]|uniref:Uncharacterized protein n=1 Tax=Shewanella gaetbuli TaxID=220752 RepID=A0A9X2CLT7_9GAMM|nr:hypothetical protein [Shewanella gaetbuli]MCL1142955.1 hypothetical protein [Shewanella gaetbuli]